MIEKINSINVKKIAVIHTLNIGDSIVLTPALNGLIEQYGQDKIFMVCSYKGYEVFKGLIPENHFFIYQNSSIIQYLKFIYRLKKQKFDLIIDFHNSFFGYKLYFLPFLSSVRKTIRIGFKRIGYEPKFFHTQIDWVSEKQHEVDAYLELLRPLGFFLKHKKFYCYQNPQINRAFDGIVIHPCCLDERKHWDSQKFADLAQWLVKKYDTQVFITGLKTERKIVEEIFSYIKDKEKIIDVAGKLNFQEFVCLIKQAKLLISIDTSAIHLATALGTKTIALFGPTNPLVWAPYDKEKQWVVRSNVECSPCDKNFKQKECNNNICLKKIELRDVQEKVEEIL